jgi:hypothetical protein
MTLPDRHREAISLRDTEVWYRGSEDDRARVLHEIPEQKWIVEKF